MSKILVDNITYSYTDGQFALSDIALSIVGGEILGIIGPNGSGKSTLLRCISGQLLPQSGHVDIDNKCVQKYGVNELSRTMSLIQQHFAIEYRFTVLEIVLMGRNPYVRRTKPYAELDYDLARSALKRVDMYDLKDRDVTTLSGGEWQRMVIARALCQQASIMLLDEPVTGLDIKHQVNLMNTIKQLSQERDLTVVCVLHDLNLAYQYCDKVLILKDGNTVSVGAPEKVLKKEILEKVYETQIREIKSDGQILLLPVY